MMDSYHKHFYPLECKELAYKTFEKVTQSLFFMHIFSNFYILYTTFVQCVVYVSYVYNSNHNTATC